MRPTALILVLWTAHACAAPTPYAAQLARECNALISQATQRPYGWAWPETLPPAAESKPQPMAFEPPGSAGAGYVLYWSGELLDEPTFREAAFNVARGMAAARQPTGQIPNHPTFPPGAPAGHDAPALVPQRGATRAALGLTLTLLDDTAGKDELLHRLASPSLTWLLKQQPANGAWPQGYPPTAAPADAFRMTRLDTPDYRDSVFTMLLAHDILHDAGSRISVERAVRELLRMRIGGASRLGDPLWATAYGLDHFPTDRVPGFPPAIDVLASRNAMQILLASYVMLGDPPPSDEGKNLWSRALADAAAAAAKLPKFDGQWLRLYDYDVPATPPPPSTQPALFSTKPPVIPPAQRTGTWGLDTLIEDAQNLTDAGRDKFTIALNANLTIRQRLAAAACGLDDDPFAVDSPIRPEDVATYLKEHAERFKSLDEPMPAGLNDRVRRLYLLLIRAKLEKRAIARG